MKSSVATVLTSKDFIAKTNAAELHHVDAFGERADFDELVTLGCIPEVLSTFMLAVALSRLFAFDWKERLSSSHDVRTRVNLLNKAASELEWLYGTVSTDLNAPIVWPNSLSPSPPEVIKSLRLYGILLESMLVIAPRIRADYIVDIPRYLLTSYVRMKTGEFCDRPVAALLSVAWSTPATATQERFTDAEAQRAWRSRRWAELNEHFEDYLGLINKFESFLAL